jgi:hypothetical protein
VNPASLVEFVDVATGENICTSENLPFIPRIGETVCFEVGGKFDHYYTIVNVVHLISSGVGVMRYLVSVSRKGEKDE